MTAFALHASPGFLAELGDIVATEDGGIAVLVETEIRTVIPGLGTAIQNELTASVFGVESDGTLFQIGSDFAPDDIPASRGFSDVTSSMVFLHALRGGGFAAYGVVEDLATSGGEVLVRQFDSEGVLVGSENHVLEHLPGQLPFDFGFGAQQFTGWVDTGSAEIVLLDPLTGLIQESRIPDDPDASTDRIGFDGGHVLDRSRMFGGTLQTTLALTESAPEAAYPVEVPEGAFLVQELCFAAGNVLVSHSESDAADISSIENFTLSRPNTDAPFRTVTLTRAGNVANTTTTEIEGVGFAVMISYVALGSSSAASQRVELHLFDYEGDRIAKRILTEPVGATLLFSDSMHLVALSDAEGIGGLRILPVWLDDRRGEKDQAQWMAEVQLFTPELNNRGTSVNDFLRGFSRDDTLAGDGGNDLIQGEAGNDRLLGNEGSDRLSGGVGEDVLIGSEGADILAGGEGADALFGGDDGDLLDAGAGDDRLDGGDGNGTLRGGGGSDSLIGGDDDDLLEGGADADTLNGGLGQDRLDGGEGADRLNGALGDDTVAGRGGNDLLNGSIGADSLIGGAGADTLTGGSGADRLLGEAGRDRFVFAAIIESTPGEVDVIEDFDADQNDRIDLSGIDAIAGRAGNNAFNFISRAEFSGKAGELREIFVTDGQIRIEGDVDGDRNADFAFFVLGENTLLSVDFVL